MEIEVRRSMTSIVVTCNKKISRVTKKLKNYCSNYHKYSVGNDFIRQCEKPRRGPMGSFRKTAGLISLLAKGRLCRSEGDGEDGHNDQAIWRKTILMGEKCVPLDDSDVICYDNIGGSPDHAPHRTPHHSMIGFSTSPSFHLAAKDGVAGFKSEAARPDNYFSGEILFKEEEDEEDEEEEEEEEEEEDDDDDDEEEDEEEEEEEELVRRNSPVKWL